MTETETLIADLAEASRIAKAGAETPLVGGPIGLWWGIMLTVTFTLHYLILTQILAVPGWWLGWLWFGFGTIGTAGSFILGRKIDEKTGAHSLLNRVEQFAWMMFAFTMLSLAIGVILNIWLNTGGIDLFTLVLIFGFAGQGLVYGLTAKLTGHGWLHFAAFGGFTMAAVTMSFYGDAVVYVIAALGSIVTIIIPSILSIRKAA